MKLQSPKVVKFYVHISPIFSHAGSHIMLVNIANKSNKRLVTCWMLLWCIVYIQLTINCTYVMLHGNLVICSISLLIFSVLQVHFIIGYFSNYKCTKIDKFPLVILEYREHNSSDAWRMMWNTSSLNSSKKYMLLHVLWW